MAENKAIENQSFTLITKKEYLIKYGFPLNLYYRENVNKGAFRQNIIVPEHTIFECYKKAIEMGQTES